MDQPKLIKPKLWIFGPSMCQAHGVSEDDSWPSLLADKINAECVNRAEIASDNFAIYSCYLENKRYINSIDTVIVGWSHPSRKSFVFDETNPLHQEIINTSLIYTRLKHKFMRNNNPVNDSPAKWTGILSKTKSNKFYDTWFDNYYSEYEQNTNFQSYYDSVKLTAPCRYIPIYFSKESVSNISIEPTLFYLDFILDNKCSLSKTDYHLNKFGHQLFVEAILPFVKYNKNPLDIAI